MFLAKGSKQDQLHRHVTCQTGPHTWKGPAPDLVLCCCYLEFNTLTEGPTFSFCTEPWKLCSLSWTSDLCDRFLESFPCKSANQVWNSENYSDNYLNGQSQNSKSPFLILHYIYLLVCNLSSQQGVVKSTKIRLFS